MTAIIELINKVLDFVKSFLSKRGDTEKSETRKEKPKSKDFQYIMLKDFTDANERKNFANCAKRQGITLPKNVDGELLVGKEHLKTLAKAIVLGKIRGAKCIEVIRRLEKIARV